MQYPQGAKLFLLRPHHKEPMPGTHGHLDAVPAEAFNLAEGANYGISLDGQWLLVDIDRPQDPIAVEWGTKLPDTWTQKTPRGTHRLYRLPSGFDGKNNKFPAGDLKVRGYLVGPGSEVDGKTYFMLDSREPVSAPQWLLDQVDKNRPSEVVVNGEVWVNERDRIAIGENDIELFSIACNLRRRGFTESAISQMLEGIIASGVVEQVPGQEYSHKDITRLARQAARYDPELGQLAFVEEDWICAEDIALVGPPLEWWVHGFVPRAELVMLYGPGAVGKSSWGSWLASVVTRKGGKFVFAGVEEPFARFAARAILGGADRSRLFAIPNAALFSLPRDTEDLKKQIILTEADVLYFDSVYSHFTSVPGENAAERARKSLAPLAEISNSTGCTIVAVFHENKAGMYLGSVEMINVPRYVLRAMRSQGQPLRVAVDKTNIHDPGYQLQFVANAVDLKDPESGRVQMEVTEQGELVPMKIVVLDRGEDVEGFMQDEKEDKDYDLIQSIREILDSNPEASSTAIWKQVGGRKQRVMEIVKALRIDYIPVPVSESIGSGTGSN